MGYFIIALFGILFYAVKYCGEKSTAKSTIKASNNSRESGEQRQDEWELKVLDDHLEGRLRALFERATCDEIDKALLEIGWNGEMSRDPKQYKEDALRLLMSSKGKLTRNDVAWGISSHGAEYPSSRAGALLNVRSYNIVMFINDQLKRHGIDEPMYVCGRGQCFHLNDKNSHIGRQYVWEPMYCYVRSEISEPPPHIRILCGIDEPTSGSLSDALK